MPSLQIRQMPDDLYQALSFRAEQAHRSLTQQTLVELELALGGGGKQKRLLALQKIRQRHAQQGSPTVIPGLEAGIRADRER